VPGLFSIRSGGDIVTGALQDARHRLAQAGFIVDNQDMTAGAHAALLSMGSQILKEAPSSGLFLA